MIGEAKAIVPTAIGIPVSRMKSMLFFVMRERASLSSQWRARTGKTEIEKILGMNIRISKSRMAAPYQPTTVSDVMSESMTVPTR